MMAVVVTMAITSPLLTLWSTTLLTGNPDPNQFMSLLGAHVSGAVLASYIALTGSLLLIFASNTAVIGAYHVFISLSRMGFLPRVLERRNRWRKTPHWAILLSVSVPLVLVVLSNGQADFLGDLYAFGLLGAFIVTNVALDVVRWHDAAMRQRRLGRTIFWLGLLSPGDGRLARQPGGQTARDRVRRRHHAARPPGRAGDLQLPAEPPAGGVPLPAPP
jgi:amino acid transporter